MPATLRREPARRAPLLAALATALVLAVTGCSSSGDEAGDASSAVEAESAGSASDSGGSAAPGEALAGGGEEAGAAAAREIVTTGSATVVADDPAAAATRLARLVEEAGGRVERRSETAATADSPGSASMTVRLPADRMTGAVEALGTLGTVEHVDVQSTDVTGEGQDLDARIAALTTSTDRLRELMSTAGSTEDLLQVEQELSDRQADLDALTAQRQRLSDQVAMSTLDVEIVPEPVAAAQSRGGFLGGLAAGWGALVTTVQTVVLVLGALLPWLALAGAGYLGYRWLRRRTRPSADAGGGSAGGSSDGSDDEGPQGPGAPSPAPLPSEPEDSPEPVPAGR
jgi:glycine cleavage system regulatory protein